MTNKNLTIGLLITLVIAVIGVFSPVGQSMVKSFGTAVDCQSNTCLTSLGVTGAFQADGASILNGTVALNGAVTSTAALASSQDITTSAQFGVGTTSPTVIEISATSAGTTTIGSFSTAKGGCIQLTGSAGSLYRLYVGGAGTLVTEAGSCR